MKKINPASALMRLMILLPVACCIQSAMAQSSSDACGFAGGNQYTVSTSCTFQDFDKNGSYGPDYNPGTCSAGNFDDAYGWFQATSTTTNVTFDPDNSHDAILHVFSGACGSLVQLGCSDALGNGGNETVSVATTIGSNYVFRVQRDGTDNSMDGRICVWGIPPPPANDDPCGATSLTVGTSCSSISATNVSATATAGPPAPGCAAYTTADVWFSFVVPASGSINIETSAGSLTDGGVAIYSAAACAGPFTLISCDDSNGPGNMGQAQASGLTVGTTYYARVWGNGGATGTFTICAHALTNDNPCSAASLTVGTSCSAIGGTNVNATTTTGPPAPGCAAFSSADVWYSFVAPAIGSIALETIAGSLTDGGAAIYSAASCTGPFTLLTCDDNNGGGNMSLALYNGLTAGTTYYVRVWGNGGATGTFTICAYALPNDNPCGATSLVVGSTCTPTSSTNASATTTTGPPAPGCAAFTSGDVWFSFVAPAGGAVNLETSAGTLTDGGVAIYSAPSCAGAFTLIACDDNSGPGNMGFLARTGLTIGATYYVRVWGNGGASGTFGICVSTPLVNDDPCGAVALTVNTTCTSTNGSNVASTSTAGPPAPGCAAFSGADVWFSFVAPASGSVNLETNAGTLTDGGMALYSAPSCGGAFTLVACDDNNGPGNMSFLQNTGLTAGSTYYVRVWGNNGATGTFSICAYAVPNDNPCGATALTVNSSCSLTASTNVNATSTAGVPAPTCASYTAGDVWFSFVAPASGVANIETTAGSLTDSGMELYSATACNGTFTSIECDNNDGPGSMSEILRTGLTPGQTYYVRMWGASGATGTFNICVWAPPPPANDDPCAAIALMVNTSCTTTASTNVGSTATAGVPAPTCGTYAGGDVWYTFVAPASGFATIETSANGLTDTGMELYSATACNGTFTSIECDDNDGPGNMSEIIRSGLTPGQTYYVRIWGTSGARGTYGICVWDHNPPVNDEPCVATALTLGTTCSNTSHTNMNATLTASIPDPGCGGYSGSARDVWFSFTAPSTGTVHFQVTAGTLTNAAMALYAATACNGTFYLVECDDNDGPANTPFLYFYDLVPGDTYYLRVWGNGGSSGTFDLCAVTPPTTGNCFYALHLNDSGGDGWGGSTIGVSINGGAYTNYTLSTGNRGMVYLPLNFGDIIVLNYTAVGGFQNEISYILQSGYGTLFSAGPTPGTGVVYGHTNDCVAPDAPHDDCYGSVALCAAVTVNSNPGNTGLKPDLNAYNRGCLSNDERQGTWFHFGISASGTLEFTLVPSNTGDDYDFALWGPETSVVCPPSEAPYRCSYSGATGNTGLLLGSGDDSEGSNGNKFVNAMNVTVGEVYVLYVSNWSQSGLAFDLTWNLTNGASIDCTVLPIELLSFRADALTTSVALDWATASESGNSHFVVERSMDGEHFAAIGQVQGAGDSYTTLEYAFLDPQPTRGINYYRLKQVDLDGSFSYSKVEAASFGLSISVGTPFPNPATGSVNVEAEVTVAGDAALLLHDASGRVVRSESLVVGKGKQLLTTSVDGLDPGSYILSVSGTDGTTTRAGRFVVQ